MSLSITLFFAFPGTLWYCILVTGKLLLQRQFNERMTEGLRLKVKSKKENEQAKINKSNNHISTLRVLKKVGSSQKTIRCYQNFYIHHSAQGTVRRSFLLNSQNTGYEIMCKESRTASCVSNERHQRCVQKWHFPEEKKHLQKVKVNSLSVIFVTKRTGSFE